MTDQILNYIIKDPLELNLSYISFVRENGLFIPTKENFTLGDKVKVELQLPGKKESLKIEGKIVWITPLNALHHVLPGVGIQFIGEHAKNLRSQIEANLNPSMEIGGYTCGITETAKGEKVV